MIKYLVLFMLSISVACANDIQTDEINEEAKVDCLILKDKNSIICKFEAVRSTDDQNVTLQWINPEGDISRTRDMIVPSGHGSIYDFRFIEGRALGEWTFKAIVNSKEYTTQFELN